MTTGKLLTVNNYRILISKNDRGERYYSVLDLFNDEPIIQLRDWVKTNLDLDLLEKSVVLLAQIFLKGLMN